MEISLDILYLEFSSDAVPCVRINNGAYREVGHYRVRGKSALISRYFDWLVTIPSGRSAQLSAPCGPYFSDLQSALQFNLGLTLS